MRIVYVTETWPPEINGVALTAERAVRHLRSAGHSVQLVRPRQRGEAARDDEHEWRTLGVPIPLYPRLQFGWASAHALRRRWQALAPDLVHVATPGPLARAALRAARSLGIAATADFRTNFHAYSRHYRLGARLACAEPLVLAWLRALHDAADRSFVPTQEVAQQLSRQGFQRLEVVGRGVDAQRFDPARRDDALRASWGVRDGEPVLLYVGRLAPEKNVALALASFERLARHQRDLHMVVAGDGPLRNDLEQAHPRVRFVGEQRGDDLARLYASADLFLFPSLTETFGNVTLEAMASGLVVVAFDTAAAHAHAVHGVSAHLVPVPRGEALEAPPQEAFFAAATWALQSAAPGSAMRRAARAAALAAQWDGVLRAFEARLHDAAMAVQHRRLSDAALA